MLKITDNGKIIDLKTLPATFEIPIESLFSYNMTTNENGDKTKKDVVSEKDLTKFSFEDLEIHESSSALKFNSSENSVLVNITGPKECRYREKTKNECCIVEVYTKHNIETKKESKALPN